MGECLLPSSFVRPRYCFKKKKISALWIGQNGVSWLCLKGMGTQGGKSTGGWKAMGRELWISPRTWGAPPAAGNQPGTHVRLGEDCWGHLPPWLENYQRSLLALWVYAAPTPKKHLLRNQILLEAKFELSWSIGSLGGHRSRRCQSPGVLCDGETATLLPRATQSTNDCPVTCEGGPGEQDWEGN